MEASSQQAGRVTGTLLAAATGEYSRQPARHLIGWKVSYIARIGAPSRASLFRKKD